MVVAVTAGETFAHDDPGELFQLPGDRYDVSPDARRFVCTQAPDVEPSTTIRVIVDWTPSPLP
jgi:hypothetical protein